MTGREPFNNLINVRSDQTSGIHGGKTLVSTFNLQDSKPTGKGGYSGVKIGYLKSELFHGGGEILV